MRPALPDLTKLGIPQGPKPAGGGGDDPPKKQDELPGKGHLAERMYTPAEMTID